MSDQHTQKHTQSTPDTYKEGMRGRIMPADIAAEDRDRSLVIGLDRYSPSNKTVKVDDTQTYLQGLYEQDYFLWIQETVRSLKEHKLDDVDLENLIEEIESMGRSEQRELKKRLRVLLMHLLKYQYQPEKRSSSWNGTIIEQHRQIESLLKDSPSLKPHYQNIFSECYDDAIIDAADETKLRCDAFPVESPFSPEDVIDRSYISSFLNS